MIPPFDEHGNLPFGVHRSTVDDLVNRFGSGSPEREVQTEELVKLIEWARKAGVRRLVVNGSYATSKIAPNDVDIIILPDIDYPRDQQPISDELAVWPFLQVFVAADDADLDRWALEDFGTDRRQRQKGVVEVIL